MPSLSNARANSIDFTHVWISEPAVVMEIFIKDPRRREDIGHVTSSESDADPVYPFLVPRTYSP